MAAIVKDSVDFSNASPPPPAGNSKTLHSEKHTISGHPLTTMHSLSLLSSLLSPLHFFLLSPLSSPAFNPCFPPSIGVGLAKELEYPDKANTDYNKREVPASFAGTNINQPISPPLSIHYFILSLFCLVTPVSIHSFINLIPRSLPTTNS